MRALISGQAGLAVVLGKELQVRSVDGEVRSAWDSHDALRVLDGCADVVEVEEASVAAIDRLTTDAWGADRALTLFLLLMDWQEPEDELSAYAECVAEFLESPSISEAVERRLFSAPLPKLVEIQRVSRACASHERVRTFFERLVHLQESVGRVSDAFESVDDEAFGDTRRKRAVREALVDEGAFRDLSVMLAESRDIGFARLQIASRHRDHAPAVLLWLAKVQPGTKPVPRSALSQANEPDDDDGWAPDARVGASYETYLQVRQQQRAVLDQLKERDIASARWLVQRMIASQEPTSTAEQVAKSLCVVAQMAKLHEIPELQLEWAEWATTVAPHDPVTFGHLSDALIGVGRYGEAGAALEAVDRLGDHNFAASGRARILRMTGRLFEAREAYLTNARQNDQHPEVKYSWLGATETLRDMGRLEEALSEYEGYTRRWPIDAVVWAGLASTLMDMGRLDDAIRDFGKAASRETSAVARCGRATAYKLSGQFDTALKLYDEVIAEYPNNHGALCGRAEVLRIKGDSEAALTAYDHAVARSPFSPVPVSGKASLLRELGRYDEALDVYRVGQATFPFDRGIATGLAAVLRSQGRFREALAELDRLVAEFPFEIQLRVHRAAVLKQLGFDEEALRVYSDLLADRPYIGGAALGKASLLLKLGRLDEAGALLPDARPKSQFEWRRYVLRTFLVERQLGFGAAARLLERGMTNCPFIEERRLMRSSLASLELRRGRQEHARQVVESAPQEVSNVIALHVFAATHRPGRARGQFEHILARSQNANVIELAVEIARRHNLVDEPPRHTADWIHRTERDFLLAEAA